MLGVVADARRALQRALRLAPVHLLMQHTARPCMALCPHDCLQLHAQGHHAQPLHGMWGPGVDAVGMLSLVLPAGMLHVLLQMELQ